MKGAAFSFRRVSYRPFCRVIGLGVNGASKAHC